MDTVLALLLHVLSHFTLKLYTLLQIVVYQKEILAITKIKINNFRLTKPKYGVRFYFCNNCLLHESRDSIKIFKNIFNIVL